MPILDDMDAMAERQGWKCADCHTELWQDAPYDDPYSPWLAWPDGQKVYCRSCARKHYWND